MLISGFSAVLTSSKQEDNCEMWTNNSVKVALIVKCKNLYYSTDTAYQLTYQYYFPPKFIPAK